jgi:hypothetical protein
MINKNKVTDLEFENVNGWDAPDFVDAYISYANVQDTNGTWRAATEEELDELNDDPDFVYESLIYQLH